MTNYWTNLKNFRQEPKVSRTTESIPVSHHSPRRKMCQINQNTPDVNHLTVGNDNISTKKNFEVENFCNSFKL